MAEPIRVCCDAPEYSETWIDIVPRWTQNEIERLYSLKEDEFYSFLRTKTVAMHIQTNGGDVLTDPSQLNDEDMGEVDVLLISWLGASMNRAIAKRRVLGNAFARLSLPVNGTAPTMTPTTAAPTT
jgi:hypothetical protein